MKASLAARADACQVRYVLAMYYCWRNGGAKQVYAVPQHNLREARWHAPSVGFGSHLCLSGFHLASPLTSTRLVLSVPGADRERVYAQCSFVSASRPTR